VFADSQNEKVRIGFHKSISGGYYTDAKNYITNAYKSINVDLTYVDYPVGRGMKEFRSKNVDADLIRQKSIYSDTEAIFIPTKVGTGDLRRYCFKSFCEKVRNKPLKELVGVSIRGVHYLKLISKDHKIILVNSTKQLFKMLESERAHYVIIPFPTKDTIAKNFIPFGATLGTFDIFHWVQKNKAHLVAPLNDYFKRNPFNMKQSE
jgi:hypothetical protein